MGTNFELDAGKGQGRNGKKVYNYIISFSNHGQTISTFEYFFNSSVFIMISQNYIFVQTSGNFFRGFGAILCTSGSHSGANVESTVGKEWQGIGRGRRQPGGHQTVGIRQGRSEKGHQVGGGYQDKVVIFISI